MNDPQVYISRWFSGTLTPVEQPELFAWIRENRANAREFAQAAYVHRRLHDLLAGQHALQQMQLQLPADIAMAKPSAWRSARHPALRTPSTQFSVWRIAAVLAFIATAVFTLTSPLWMGWKKAVPLATLTDAVDAQWDTTQENMPQQLNVGDALPHGPLVLQAGYAHITLGNGVNLVLKGPAHFSVDSLQKVQLEQGKLTADVPHTASGFTIKMPTASVTDLGTTFGVTAYLNGQSTVQVLKGKVEARLLDDHGATKVQSELTQDHAVAINPFLGTVASIPAEPDAYLTDIRRVPVKLALHNTGAGLKSDAADPHWQITAYTLDPAWKSQPARVIDPAAALGSYYAPDRPTDSQWISVPGNPNDLPNGCQITFTTTIDLTDIDPTTVRLQLHLLADNGVAEVRLNGQKTNIRFPDSFNTLLPDYFRFHNYTLDSGFVPGKNTLEFVVQNISGAMGFRADMEGTAVKVIPGAPAPNASHGGAAMKNNAFIGPRASCPPNTAAKMAAPRRGFTLIELLVVVGVLVLLLSIILPALSMFRHTAKTAQCASNLRELGKDTQCFLINNAGIFYPYAYASSGDSLWVNQLRPYGNLDVTRFCPEAPGRTPNIVTTTIGGGGKDQAGTANDGWIWYDPTATYQPYPFFSSAANIVANNNGGLPPTTLINLPASSVGSYGVNGFFYPDAINYGPASVAVYGRWRFSSSGNGATIPLYIDSMWTDAWPDSANTLPNTVGMATYNTQLGPGINSFGGMDRFTLSRHNRAVNVVFADGHVQLVPLAQLWTLNWHPNYVQPATLPVIPYP